MADPAVTLESTFDEFIEAWEKFLLDEIDTAQVTDYIICMLRAREAQDASDGTFELL